MRIARRYRAALTAALGTTVGTALALAPVHNAVADDTPTPPSITVNCPGKSLDIYGPGLDFSVTVQNPPTTDAFIRLYTYSPTADLHFTDGSGNELPLQPDGNLRYIDIDATDTDANGIPGAPLTAGDIPLHVSSGYPIATNGSLTAQLIDGSTGAVLAEAARTASGYFYTDTAYFWGQYPQVTVSTGATAANDPITVDMTMATPPPATTTRLVVTAQQLAAAGYTAQQAAVRLHAGIYTGRPTPTPLTWAIGADGSLSTTLPAEQWTQPDSTATQHLSLAADWGTPAANLTGTLEVRDTDDRLYSTQPQTFQITTGPIPAYLRWDRFARDSHGVLWASEGTGNATSPSTLFKPRVQIGTGWNTYTAMTSLNGQRADGAGAIVARDKYGVLWLYPSRTSGTAPLPARVKAGTGWNGYNALNGAGDITADGRPDLIACDTHGYLWLYKGTTTNGAPFAPRIRIGTGWLGFNTLVGVGDLTSDGHPDLLARGTDGRLWLYAGTGNPTAPFHTRIQIGTGWNTYTILN